jgi:hypothetical protein
MLETGYPGQRRREWPGSLNPWDLFRLEELPSLSPLPRQAHKAEAREHEST